MSQSGQAAAAAADLSMSAGEFRLLFDRLRGGNPWGPADRRGALNAITPAHIVAAAGQVRMGRTVSLAAQVEHEVAADNPNPWVHQLSHPATGQDGKRGLDFALDSLALQVHGNADSHMDALCHVVYDGMLYNDVVPDTWTDDATGELSIGAAARQGIAGRGVLLDIPRLRGSDWLQPGEHVTVADLLGAEKSQDVRIGEGDVLFVRVGHRRRRTELGPWNAASARAGLHPSALELLADRRIAVLGSDGNNDTAPSAADGVEFPVHVLALRALGLMLLDYLQFEDLVPVCETTGRWSFLCVIAPLRLPLGTGSPVNPIAIF
ncbi:MAG: cyclase family protein [Streptosporangiaceae bacterium]